MVLRFFVSCIVFVYHQLKLTLLLHTTLVSCPTPFVSHNNFFIFLNSCHIINKIPNLGHGFFYLTLVLTTQKLNLETVVLFCFLLIGFLFITWQNSVIYLLSSGNLYQLISVLPPESERRRPIYMIIQASLHLIH